VLALPKLNLQFLTPVDYLLRNFNLFRLEATYEIREDIVDVVKRLGPYLGDDERVGCAGAGGAGGRRGGEGQKPGGTGCRVSKGNGRVGAGLPFPGSKRGRGNVLAGQSGERCGQDRLIVRLLSAYRNVHHCHANLLRCCFHLRQVGFSGWARMAHTIDKFAITEVRKPKVGENKPAAVTGECCRAEHCLQADPRCAGCLGMSCSAALFLLWPSLP
jgi:hypothetical protein